MCLIAIAPKGTDKYSEFFLEGLRESAKRNNDGFGFAYRDADKSVYFQKGIMSIGGLIERLESLHLTTESELIVHLRMRSAGKVCPENCHPFEVNHLSESVVLEDTNLHRTVRPVLFHNGTFSNFIPKGSERSDTFHFVENFLRIKGVWNMFKKNRETFMEAFKEILGSNKLAIMGRELPETILIGDFQTKEGYIFSNSSFERYGRTPSGIASTTPQQRQEMVLQRHSQTTLNTLDRATGYTKEIKINDRNYNDFFLKAHMDSATVPSVKKGDVWELKQVGTYGSWMLGKVGTKGTYVYMMMPAIEMVFLKVPKDFARDTYFDYFRLKALINPVTNTAVKKIYNKILNVSRSRNNLTATTNIAIKYQNTERPYQFKAILMFLLDNLADHEYRVVDGMFSEYILPKKEYLN